MKSGLGRRILALGLAFTLCFCDAVPSFAEDINNESSFETSIDVSELNSFEEPMQLEEEVEGLLDWTSTDVEVELADEALAEEVLSEEAPDEAAAPDEVVVDNPVGEDVETEGEIEVEETEAESLVAEEVLAPEEAVVETPEDEAEATNEYAVSFDGKTFTVTLQNPGDVPAGSELTVSGADSIIEEAKEAILEALGDSKVLNSAVAYDISFVCGEDKVNPENDATVKISSIETGDETYVYSYNSEQNSISDMSATAGDGSVEYSASDLSVFVIANVSNAPIETSSLDGLRLYNYKSSNSSSAGINAGRIFKFLKSANEIEGWNINQWTSDKKESMVRAKLVESLLGEDGYPVLARGYGSLGYLFPENPTSDGVSEVYNNVSGLFVMENGYYTYDSDKYYAKLDRDNNNIVVTEDTTTKRFEPFADKKTKTYVNAYNSNNNINFFGLTFETDFIQPKNGKVLSNGQLEDMVFEFSGDDDVWVFIDGVLVLDIGGVHSRAAGSINFATGVVTQPKARSVEGMDATVYNSTVQTIRDILIASGKFDASDFEEGSNTLSDYTQHTMKVFYFERGAVESNFKIKFNLQTIPNGTLVVSKQVVDTANVVPSNKNFSFTVRANDGSYPAEGTSFDVYVNGTKNRTESLGANGHFTLKDGESAYFELPDEKKYTVVENNIDANKVVVNGNIYTEFDEPVGATATISTDSSASILFKNCYLSNEVEVTKTASVKDYDNRLYRIDITADYYGTDVTENSLLSEDQPIVLVTKKANVVDYIDTRFVVTDEAGVALSNGDSVGTGTLVIDENGEASVVWNNEDIGHGTEKQWTGVIYVKAKEEFLGGNVITTNGPLSYVSVGDVTKILPQPTVNVKALTLNALGGEETFFLGEMIPGADITKAVADTVKVIELDGTAIDYSLSEDEIALLVENGSLKKDYSFEDTNDLIGTIDYTIESDRGTVANHKATEIGTPFETYTLTVSYNPYSVLERTNSNTISPVGTEVDKPATTASADYLVNVVDGTFKVVKVIDISEVEWTDGDPIFTFELKNDATGKTITKVAHFNKADFAGKSGEVTLEVNFTGLAKGSYTVRELDTLGYVYIAGSITNEVTLGDVTTVYSFVDVGGKSTPKAGVVFGTKDSTGDYVTLNAVLLKNKKVNEYFMDRDELVNVVTTDNEGNTVITQTRETDHQVFATKEELDAYVLSLQANE